MAAVAAADICTGGLDIQEASVLLSNTVGECN